jgi:hypothetical protein
MAGTGLENRRNILPQPEIPKKVPGVFGPDYSFADSVPLPGQIGVRDGDDFNSVMDAVKGAAFYMDTIGFGEASTGLTRGMPLKPIGVNSWLRTGMKCSNGAEAWSYLEGIPRGDALGKRLADGLKSAGFPGMRGLAPGMIEDAKEALNPVPILGAVFGSGFPVCRLESKPVGDQDGKIQNPSTGAYYVENPESVEYKGGKPFQSRWVVAGDLDQGAWEKAPKTHCPDGYPVKNHRDSDCKKEIMSMRYEGFNGGGIFPFNTNAVLTAVALVGVGLFITKLKY